MLTCDLLRERIRTMSATADVVDALNLEIAPEKLLEEASDQIIVNAFCDGSMESETLRRKIHTRPIPEAGTQNIGKGKMKHELARGFWHAKAFTELAEKYGNPFEEAKMVLDFGCGTSRLLRYLVDFLPGPQYCGSEVNPENIEWGNKHYPEVNYILHAPEPPIECDNEVFDIIYAQSIFSHYSEQLHSKWLTELHRILKPRGMIIVTKEGRHLIDRCKSEQEMFKKLGLDKENVDEIWQNFEDTGFAFYTRYNKKNLERRGIDSDNWGTAFIDDKYINSRWTTLFEILEIQPGAVGNRQDYVVMRKK